jgi:hypothetical protein
MTHTSDFMALYQSVNASEINAYLTLRHELAAQEAGLMLVSFVSKHILKEGELK